jgi:AraC-like DNA-binding protein
MFFNDKKEKIIYVGSHDATDTFLCTLAGVTYPNADYRIHCDPSLLYVFEYVISGKGYLEHQGKLYPVEAGDFYMFKKGAKVTYYADRSDPYEKIWMNMDGALLGNMINLFVPGEVYTARANVLDLFLAAHDKLAQINSSNIIALNADIFSILFEILMTATKEVYFPSTPQKFSLDERIKNYIDANLYNDISLDDVSEKFDITKMHIIRVFKKKYNTTPIQYLIDRKIGIAKSLLTGTVMPIKEISALLHYSNTQHFSSTFKNTVGTTPNKFRQASRKFPLSQEELDDEE